MPRCRSPAAATATWGAGSCTPTAVIRDTAGTLGRLYGARNTPQYAIVDPALPQGFEAFYNGSLEISETMMAGLLDTLHTIIGARRSIYCS